MQNIIAYEMNIQFQLCSFCMRIIPRNINIILSQMELKILHEYEKNQKNDWLVVFDALHVQ